MEKETEVKVELADREAIQRRIEMMLARESAARHFEDNFVLDFKDGRLGAQRCLLRIRETANASLLTFKGPPADSAVFKIREELETGIADGKVLLEILVRLGLRVAFRYQKYRREYRLAPLGSGGPTVHLALDETPIGDFLEIEGEEDGIRRTAEALGIPASGFLRDSYYSLYLHHCKTKGLKAGFMLFPVDGKDG